VCGIVGVVTRDSAETWTRAVERGMDAIRHRGPDDRGSLTIPARGDGAHQALGGVLGNQRLAIIDLSPRGHMPMISADGNVGITYNGEIYNFRELRDELRGLGHEFTSTSDTEVILRGYEEWGDRVVERLNGMFAFAILDRGSPGQRRSRCLIARDRVGVKPCYYVLGPHGIAFASELKALRATGLLSAELDWQALADYFTYLFIPGPRTAYADARQLPPGHCLVWEEDRGEPEIRRYWSPIGPGSLFASGPTPLPMPAAAGALRDLLHDSVRRQLISDVPVGVFLSGGIDSTILTALAAMERTRLKTFTVIFEGPGITTIDDREFSRAVAERYATQHEEIVVDVSDPSEMLELVSAFDQPFGNPTFYLSYLVSRLTREHVTVALSGAGGDELFGGYPRYLAVPFSRTLGMFPRPLAGAVTAVAARWPEDYESATPRRMKLLLRGLGEPFAEQYVRWTYFFSDAEKKKLLAPLYRRLPDLKPAVRVIADAFEESAQLTDPRARAQYADLLTFLPDNILEYTDRTSMAVSLEVRVPFLDHRIVEESFAMPFDHKLRFGQSKRILREAFADLIPEKNLSAPKRGFCPPLPVWIDKVFDSYLDTQLTRERVEHIGVLDWSEIQRLRAEQRHRTKDNSMQLFGIIMFDVWWQRYVEAPG